jgi:RHS repeat-associated protein
MHAGAASACEYDALNRRVARQDGTVWTEYVHDPGGNLLAELTGPATTGGTWATNREYAWLDGQPLAQLEYLQSRAAPYLYYYHLDHLGQPRALTNETGSATVWSAAPARPYGEVVETTTNDPLTGATVGTNLRLPGQYDERLFSAAGITGLQGPYQNWNRWYLPSMGRYMELDLIALRGGFNGLFGPNWYGYGEANPLSYVDPAGLYSCTYSIAAHRMSCTPDVPVHLPFDSNHYVAGHNTPWCPDCRDNPQRQCMRRTGPLPTGDYSIGNLRSPEGHRRDLLPRPGNNMCAPPLATPRDLMQTHGCDDPATCSEGCIAATDNATRDLFDQLMALESGNTLTVVP